MPSCVSTRASDNFLRHDFSKSDNSTHAVKTILPNDILSLGILMIVVILTLGQEGRNIKIRLHLFKAVIFFNKSHR